MGLGIAPQLTSFFCIGDALHPLILAPLFHLTMGRADVALPSAAAQVGFKEFAFPFEHFQDHIAVVADEGLEGDGAGAGTSEASAVGDVAVVGEPAGAIAVGAGGGFIDGGGHDCQGSEALAPMTELYSTTKRGLWEARF